MKSVRRASIHRAFFNHCLNELQILRVKRAIIRVYHTSQLSFEFCRRWTMQKLYCYGFYIEKSSVVSVYVRRQDIFVITALNSHCAPMRVIMCTVNSN